jgi:hypothetical protein
MTHNTADAGELRRQADALRAIKYTPPLGEDSSYSAAYTRSVAELAAELFATLGATADQVGDTLRAAGITGHTWEGHMVGETRADRLNPVSAWLRSLLGPGYYRYSSGEYQIDLDAPGDTEDTDAIKVPEAIVDFLGAAEDPYDDEVNRYRGILLDDDGRPRLYLPYTDTWICALINAQHPDKICGAFSGSQPCTLHPLES